MTLIQLLESRATALTSRQVAELLGVSDKHIYEMAADGILPAFHVGRSIRIDPQELADWLRTKKPLEPKPGRKTSPYRNEISTSMLETPASDYIWRKRVRSLESVLAIEDRPDSTNRRNS